MGSNALLDDIMDSSVDEFQALEEMVSSKDELQALEQMNIGTPECEGIPWGVSMLDHVLCHVTTFAILQENTTLRLLLLDFRVYFLFIFF